jgi:hypothetical protein
MIIRLIKMILSQIILREEHILLIHSGLTMIQLCQQVNYMLSCLMFSTTGIPCCHMKWSPEILIEMFLWLDITVTLHPVILIINIVFK